MREAVAEEFADADSRRTSSSPMRLDSMSP